MLLEIDTANPFGMLAAAKDEQTAVYTEVATNIRRRKETKQTLVACGAEVDFEAVGINLYCAQEPAVCTTSGALIRYDHEGWFHIDP